MPSITSWTRLEAQRDHEMETAIAARIFDPSWLLARQWQFGEFTGRDAGTLVRVLGSVTVAPLAVVQRHLVTTVPFDKDSAVLSGTWKTSLKNLAATFKRGRVITVEAHCDQGESSDLGTKRGDAVNKWLASFLTVPITVQAFGTSRLVCVETREDCSRRNRRVEIYIERDAPLNVPIEPLVERELLLDGTQATMGLSATLGAEFLYMLEDANLGKYKPLYLTSYPVVPWRLTPLDVLRPDAFLLRLQEPQGLSLVLWKRFPTALQTALKGYNDLMIHDKSQVLVDTLNEINKSAMSICFWDQATFPDIQVDDDLRIWLAECSAGGLKGIPLLSLNRKLLSAYYVAEISKVMPALDSSAGVVAARIPDGVQLRADLKKSSTGQFPLREKVAAGDRSALLAVFQAWQTWSDTLYSQPEMQGHSTWDKDRLDYNFSVRTELQNSLFQNLELRLRAEKYDGGHLDWYSFEAQEPSQEQRKVSLPNTLIQFHPEQEQGKGVMPAHVTFPGMPSPRWWAFEDAKHDLSALSVAADDLASPFILEYAFIFSGDWFWIPIEIPFGSLAHINDVSVTDNFGTMTTLSHYSDIDDQSDAWQFMTVSPMRKRHLLVPSVLGQTTAGPNVEEVVMARDELANMVWAIEKKVEGPLTVLNQAEAYQQAVTPKKPMPGVYQPLSEVPSYWLPFILQADSSKVCEANGSMDPVLCPARLVRATMIPTQSQDTSHQPNGRLIPATEPMRIFEQEVPREGLQLVRRYRFSRTADGGSLLWCGRMKTPGKGEGSSGIRFDYVDDVDPE